MNWRKLGLVIAISALVLVGSGYGAYRYFLNRYSSQIDLILADLLNEAEPDPASNTPTAPTTPTTPTDNSSATSANSSNPSSPAAPAAGTSHTSNPPPNPAATKEDSTKNPESPATNNAPSSSLVDKATSRLNLSADEQNKAESADEILEQMSTSEKLMVLKTLNRFSPPELLEMYRIYSHGDPEAVAQLKATIKAKFSAADIEVIKQMAAKYR